MTFKKGIIIIIALSVLIIGFKIVRFVIKSHSPAFNIKNISWLIKHKSKINNFHSITYKGDNDAFYIVSCNDTVCIIVWEFIDCSGFTIKETINKYDYEKDNVGFNKETMDFETFKVVNELNIYKRHKKIDLIYQSSNDSLCIEKNSNFTVVKGPLETVLVRDSYSKKESNALIIDSIENRMSIIFTKGSNTYFVLFDDQRVVKTGNLIDNLNL